MEAKDIQDWASRAGGGFSDGAAVEGATPSEEASEEDTTEPLDLRECVETLKEKAKGVRGLTIEGADMAAIADKLDEAATELEEAADMKDDADAEAAEEEDEEEEAAEGEETA